MKKILHLIGGMNVGGTETMLMNIYRNIHKDIEFHFISYLENEGYYDKEIERLGGKIIKLKDPNKVGIIKSIRDMVHVIKKNGPYNVFHGHTMYNCGIGIIAAYLAGIKVRISHSHTTLISNKGVFKKIYNFLMRICITIFSTSYLACSEEAGINLFGKSLVKKNKIEIMPNYIEYREILDAEEGEFRKKEGLENKIIVGHIGRLVKEKNHLFFLEVLEKMVKKNKDIIGVIVGEGPLASEIEESIKRRSLEKNIVKLGIRNDTKEILKDLDLLLFPSTYEGLGMVLLEAQAAGVPILASLAIQPEADLGIGLLNKESLNTEVDQWVDKGEELIGRKINDKELILKSFKDNGYEIEDIINNLEKIYKIK